MALAIPASVQACVKAIKESLSSHSVSNINPDLLHTLATKICQSFDVKRIALFCTISHRCMGIGRFCLIHNHKLDTWLEKGDAESIEELLIWLRKGRQMCVEIFDNNRLTKDEMLALKDELISEYNSVHTAILNYNDLGKDSPLMPCKNPITASMSSDGIKYIGERSMVEQCHSTVCSASGNFPTPLKLNRKIFLVDHPHDQHVPTLYTYDQLDLLHDLLPDNPAERINRFSKVPFRSDIADDLRTKHTKEIKILQCYHAWLEKPDMI